MCAGGMCMVSVGGEVTARSDVSISVLRTAPTHGASGHAVPIGEPLTPAEEVDARIAGRPTVAEIHAPRVATAVLVGTSATNGSPAPSGTSGEVPTAEATPLRREVRNFLTFSTFVLR